MADMAEMKVGEVADQTGLSIRTLRHYDDLGIVTPSGRTPGGFRLYNQRDVERLLLVRRMKPLGFTLDQMREFLESADMLSESGAGQVSEVITGFKEETRRRLEKLRRQVIYAEEFLTQLNALSGSNDEHDQPTSTTAEIP